MGFLIMHARLALVLMAGAIGGSLASCGASAPPPPTAAVTSSSAPRTHTGAETIDSTRRADAIEPRAARPGLVRVSRTVYGVALTDRRGFALYRFTHDITARSTCYGACVAAWPPYLVPGELAGRSALRSGLVSSIQRTDGRLQVTYAGHPLYYYVGDRRPGEVLCQGVSEFGGGWYVVAPSGRIVQ